MRTKPLPTVLTFCLALSAAAPALADAPNILLIVSEDNGAHLGCYGDPFAVTPNLDAMAAEGVRFSQAYVTQAGCSPSRASLYTGLYPHQHGQVGLSNWGFRLYRDDKPNLVHRLNEAGYRTGILGKLHMLPETAFPFDFIAMPESNFDRQDMAGYARRAEAFFEETEQPFFLTVNYPEAHRPWIAQVDGLPENPLGADDVYPLPQFGPGVNAPDVREIVADYYNCMARLDSLVGDLLQALERSGKAGETLVIYLGDHGADMLRGKRTCYEGGVHIPLLIRGSAVAEAGMVCDELVSTADLVPTILELTGAASLGKLAGRSLLPLLKDEPVEWRSHLFTEYHTHAATDNFYPQRAVRNQRFKLIENLFPGEVNPGYAFTMTHTKADFPAAIARAPESTRLGYERMRQPDRWELYDLDADPWEFTDLSGDPEYAPVLMELQAKLAEWRRQTADPLLDPVILARFKAEVYAVPSRDIAGEGGYWTYMDYFFDGENPVSENTD